MKKILKFMLVLIMTFYGIQLCNTKSIQAYTNNYSASQAIDIVKSLQGKTEYNGQCVGLIHSYYNALGVGFPGGNAVDFTWNTLPNGWQRLKGAQPQKGDILVYGAVLGNPYGHVAIYESDYVTYHQNFNNHQYVEKVNYIKYNQFTNPYWGVIRPDFNGNTNVTANWKFDISLLTETNAEIKATLTADRNLKFTNAGVNIWNDKGEIIKSKSEGVDFYGTYMFAYYNLNTELGLVLKPGTTYSATYWIVADGKTYNSPVQVFTTKGSSGSTSVYPERVSMNTDKATLSLGKSFVSRATVYPENAISKEVHFSSSNANVITVDSSGNVYAVGAGSAYVKATTANGKEGKTLVTVLPNPSTISISPSNASVRVGASFKATAVVTPSNAMKNVTFTSSTPAVASVDANGNVTALHAGNTYITVTTHNGKTARFLLNVYANPDAVSISPKSATIKAGASFKATSIVTPSNAVKNVMYTSSTPAVASVDGNGNVKAIHAGYTYITVTTHNGKTAKFLLRVV